MTRSRQQRVGAEVVRIGRAQRHGGAHNFADGNSTAFARQFVAAPWSAHALENLGVDESLEQSFQVTRGHFVAPARAFAATGADLECSATSTTAAMASTLRRDSRFISILLR